MEFVGPNEVHGAARGRRLLDTEKLIFDTPEDSISFCATTLVRVTARWNGRSWDTSSLPNKPLTFNIVVAPMLLGIPLECLPHAAVVIAIVLFVLWGTFRSRPVWPASLVLPPLERGKDH